MTGVPTPPSRPLNGEVAGTTGAGSGDGGADADGAGAVDRTTSGSGASAPHAARTLASPTRATILRMPPP
jgi:hypothetical protein